MKQLRNPPSAQAPHSRRAAASPSARQPPDTIAGEANLRQLKQQERISQLRNTDSSAAHGLPAALREGVEALSGQDLSDVRVHRNSSEPAQLNALAYAQGTDIHLAPGQERHLPHEAWHVVQQRQGRVAPTGSLAGKAINNNDALEQEADRMGAQALQQFSSAPQLHIESNLTPSFGVAQRHTAVLQARRIRVTYNAGMGYLSSELSYLAACNDHWYDSFPPDALTGILEALNDLDELDEAETRDVQLIRQQVQRAQQAQHAMANDPRVLADREQGWFDTASGAQLTTILNQLALHPAGPIGLENRQHANVKAKARIARLNQQGLRAKWAGDTVSACLANGTEVATFEFMDYDDDGTYWVWHLDTQAAFQNQGIGLFLMREAVNHYGQVLASRAGKDQHEMRDDEDIRYLSTEGAALVNAAIRSGIMQPDWLVNPFM